MKYLFLLSLLFFFSQISFGFPDCTGFLTLQVDGSQPFNEEYKFQSKHIIYGVSDIVLETVTPGKRTLTKDYSGDCFTEVFNGGKTETACDLEKEKQDPRFPVSLFVIQEGDRTTVSARLTNSDNYVPMHGEVRCER